MGTETVPSGRLRTSHAVAESPGLVRRLHAPALLRLLAGDSVLVAHDALGMTESLFLTGVVAGQLPVSWGRVSESPCLPAGRCSSRSDLSRRLRTRKQTWQPSRDGLGRCSVPLCRDHRAGVLHPLLGAGADRHLGHRDSRGCPFLAPAALPASRYRDVAPGSAESLHLLGIEIVKSPFVATPKTRSWLRRREGLVERAVRRRTARVNEKA